MAKLVVGPITKGLTTSVLPFNVDNDAFPVLLNAYQWRRRIKRKRGTSFLSRATRFFNSNISSYGSISSFNLNGSGNGNLISGFGLETNGNIVPGTISIIVNGITYTDPTKDGFLTPTGTNGPNTINYATGAISIPVGAGFAVTGSFFYYPQLPIMGLEELSFDTTAFPGTLVFDTVHSYNQLTTYPFGIYDVSFYKNLASGTYPLYVQKSTTTATSWNGQNYQQFYTVNYQGAFWATNGINIPFATTNIGMQFAPASSISGAAITSTTTMTMTIAGSPLVIGDFVFINEWVDNTTAANAQRINFLTGYVTAASNPGGANTITITFTGTNLPTGDNISPGIVQYLTNRSSTTIDCIRWYDGDPTNGSTTSPSFVLGKGWVNFMPPISKAAFSIADLPALQYYLVGARVIKPFKDRLLFLGPVVQSSTGSPIYLPDTVIYSQNGTPYYTASFSTDPSLASTVFTAILVPTNQTATPPAYWGDQTGFGGFITAGINQELVSAEANEDVLIAGFTTTQTRIVYTGNDLLPFSFYLIDSELSTTSTFSAINMGRGIITKGDRGLIMTTQREAARIDEAILDNFFQFSNDQNGRERVTAQRDFDREWIYFTGRSDQNSYAFPTTTLFYNYREDSWAKFNEAYTTYGQFRRVSGLTWGTVGSVYATWGDWNEPWNNSELDLLIPEVIAGNQQGFILTRDRETTGESVSLAIQSINNATNTITVPDHCLNAGDYIIISGALGTIGAQINGKIYSVLTPTKDTLILNPSLPTGSLTYSGGGLIQRMYVPFIQTKQFPTSWGIGRKTRIGVQQYLLSTTAKGQITLEIFLSEDTANPYNTGNIVPQPHPQNNSLIYSTVLYTCLESTNLGLTPANINLQMIGSDAGVTTQSQIWHRINTSLIGDTVQLGFTMSDTQMRDTNFNNQFAEIELHGFMMELTASQVLA